MACRCKHFAAKIKNDCRAIAKIREKFITRLTVDSPHHDKRKRDFNIAAFRLDGGHPLEEHLMGEVLLAFDNAASDYIKTYCDTPGCTSAKRRLFR
jgi:hypothetical protein